MAEGNAPEQAKETEAPKSGRKKTIVMGGAVLGLMAIEAVVVFFVVKNFAGGPKAAEGQEIPGIELKETAKKADDVELEVVKIRAQNERSQRQVSYSLEVYVSASETDQEKLEDILQRRKATVQDRLTRVIRAAEPERFVEPDLRTLRRPFQTELNAIVGDDKLIKEVLIPSISSSEN